MRALSFRERMREEADKSAAAAESVDPWRLTLERVRGKVDFYDGLQRVSSQTLLDLLEVPQRNRTTGTYRRLAKVMAELGWTAVRVRDLTRGGYKEQVRGYCREANVDRANARNAAAVLPAAEMPTSGPSPDPSRCARLSEVPCPEPRGSNATALQSRWRTR
jgi:hypothetical protein